MRAFSSPIDNTQRRKVELLESAISKEDITERRTKSRSNDGSRVPVTQSSKRHGYHHNHIVAVELSFVLDVLGKDFFLSLHLEA